MIAVLLNHLYTYVYINDYIGRHSVISIPLFVLLIGFTTGLVAKQAHRWKIVLKRLTNVLGTYSIAAVLYYLRGYKSVISLPHFVTKVTNFTLAPHLYFVPIYIQLVLISPVLYALIHTKSLLRQMLVLTSIYIVSRYLTYSLHVFPLPYGASSVFGGTYLFLYALGIFFCEILMQPRSQQWFKSLAVASFLLLILLEIKKVYQIMGGTPPSNSLIIYTVVFFLFFYSLFTLLDGDRTRKLLSPLILTGKASLTIYLYHWFFREIVLDRMQDPLHLSIIERVVLVLVVYLGPLILYFVTVRFFAIASFASRYVLPLWKSS